jgi:uncharacterized membrane protein
VTDNFKSLTGWLGMVPRRLWTVVVILILLAMFAVAFSPSAVVRAGMAGGGSLAATATPITATTNGMAGGGS